MDKKEEKIGLKHWLSLFVLVAGIALIVFVLYSFGKGIYNAGTAEIEKYNKNEAMIEQKEKQHEKEMKIVSVKSITERIERSEGYKTEINNDVRSTRKIDIEETPQGKVVTVSLNSVRGFDKEMSVFSNQKRTLNILKEMKGYNDLKAIKFDYYLPLIDEKGNKTDGQSIQYMFKGDTIKDYNFKDMLPENLPKLAEYEYIHNVWQ